MTGGALYIRRFMMRQYLALADQVPFGGLLLRFHRSLGSSGLISPQEAEFVKKMDDVDPSGAKVLFSTRPPRNVGRGAAGACWNVIIGTLMAPLVGLTMLPHQIHQRGLLMGIVPGLVMAHVWAVAFAVLGYVAAVQQLLYGAYHQAMSPYHFLVSNKSWNLYSCRFETPMPATAEWPTGLAHELPTATLREYAMRRVARSKTEREKKDTQYESPNKTKASSAQKSLYSVLGVASDATEKEIKEAYSKLALKLHPDRNPSKTAHEQFDEATKAYRTLSNPTKRKKYDLAGQDGVDDLGQKKRDGVRALFGGDLLQPLIGDVRMGTFSQRVIDGLDHTPDELAIVWMRMLLQSRDALLQYLDGYQCGDATMGGVPGSRHSASTGTKTVSTTATNSSADWNTTTRGKVHRFVNTGLAKELLFVVGTEYVAVCKHATSNPVQRASDALAHHLPTLAKTRLLQLQALSKARPSLLKDTAIMVDLAWYLSLSEVRYTARFAAWSVVHDGSIDANERARRIEGLRQFGAFLVASGKPYTGADKRTVDQLMESLRSYQQAKARESQV